MSELEHTTWLLDARINLFGRKQLDLKEVKYLDGIAERFPMYTHFPTRHDVPAYVFQLETDSVYSASKYKTVFAPVILHRTLFGDVSTKQWEVEDDVLAYMTLCAPGMRSVPDLIGRGYAVFENYRRSSNAHQNVVFHSGRADRWLNTDALHAFAREHAGWHVKVQNFNEPFFEEVKP